MQPVKMPVTDPELERAYRNTDYVVFVDSGELVLRIDEINPLLDALLNRYKNTAAAFLTAVNPYSAPLSDEQNSLRNAALEAELGTAGLLAVPGEGRGRDGNWPAEASFLVPGISRAFATGLAIKYEQNAYVWYESGSVARLEFPGI